MWQKDRIKIFFLRKQLFILKTVISQHKRKKKIILYDWPCKPALILPIQASCQLVYFRAWWFLSHLNAFTQYEVLLYMAKSNTNPLPACLKLLMLFKEWESLKSILKILYYFLPCSICRGNEQPFSQGSLKLRGFLQVPHAIFSSKNQVTQCLNFEIQCTWTVFWKLCPKSDT